MKIKTLAIAAATLAVGAITSQAQVYSQNIVGYVNINVVTNGYTAVTIPLDYDGTGLNNVVTNIIGTNLPNGCIVESWSGSGFTLNTYGPTTKIPTPHWSTPTATYNPGQGIFIYNPTNISATLTISGTVLTGALTNQYLTSAGYSMVGGKFPAAGGVTTTFGFTPVNGDIFESWNGSGFTLNTFGPTTKIPTPHWSGGEPQLAVGQGAFIYTTNTHPLMATNFNP